MEHWGSIAQILQGRTILVVGATGFLAKVFVEKILRIQPKVGKIYLLLRARNTELALSRFENEIMNKELFRVLREREGTKFDSFIKSRVELIPGDISEDDLGINEDSNLKEELWKQVQVVVNFAATTNFTERYDIALNTNTFGALQAYNFARRCAQIKLFLHVSTAYVSGGDGSLVLERPFQINEIGSGRYKLNIDVEKKLAHQTLNKIKKEEEVTSAMQHLGLTRAKLFGWPNTYAFTKAMGEMVLWQKKDDRVPLVIIRPTIVTSTAKEPFPGWIEGFRSIDSVIGAVGKGKIQCFIGKPEQVVDLIPADIVTNAIITIMVVHMMDMINPSNIIYHVGSSLRNPLKLATLQDLVLGFFINNPLKDRDGRTIHVHRKIRLIKSMNRFILYFWITSVLPFKALQVGNVVCCQQLKTKCELEAYERRIKIIRRWAKMYKQFAYSTYRFDDANLQKLRAEAEQKFNDFGMFTFDPNDILWEDYVPNTHIPGLVRFVIK